MLRAALHTLCLFLLVPISDAGSAELSGKVIAVADGDTITVLDESKHQVRVRLAGIDAPEKHQSFGQRAKENLARLVHNKIVVVEWTKTDRYGRLLGKVVVLGVDANLEQIREGLAWHYKQYASEQSSADRDTYARVEESARAARKGLWSDHNPIQPHLFRRQAQQSH